MAGDEPDPRSSKKLAQDPLVEKLVSDPSQHEPTIQLRGWLGKGTVEGVWRIYLTPQLNEYVEVAENDILHTQGAQSRSDATRRHDGLAQGRARLCVIPRSSPVRSRPTFCRVGSRPPTWEIRPPPWLLPCGRTRSATRTTTSVP